MNNFRNEIVTGDALTVLKSMPSNHVQTVVTSPPYFGLRDYQVNGQIGLEASPSEYIAALVEVFREVRRVLKSDGLLWLNLGDSYAGNVHTGTTGKERKWYGDNGGVNSMRGGFGLAPKNLMMIPARVAIALQEDGWILRSNIIWHKLNAMPESVTDRPTSAHEHIFLLAKSERYFYDADAIREPGQEWTGQAGTFARSSGKSTMLSIPGQSHVSHRENRDDKVPTGRNKRNVWTVNSHPYSEAHFATFPPKLIEPCILAGSRPGDIVLDPFMGAGTTALVALQYGRDYLGIELNPAYVTLAMQRIATIQPNMWEVAI